MQAGTMSDGGLGVNGVTQSITTDPRTPVARTKNHGIDNAKRADTFTRMRYQSLD